MNLTDEVIFGGKVVFDLFDPTLAAVLHGMPCPLIVLDDNVDRFTLTNKNLNSISVFLNVSLPTRVCVFKIILQKSASYRDIITAHGTAIC